ncbi:hypothetical protein AB3472_20075 [Pseudomonas lurida]|uniref:hypothetical protein n=1 Tax=Pseudomonas lurida TaxID=244566 RepID=UPI0037C9F344
MGSDFDDGSFKKSRSFLLVFSSLILVLWYFKAEMASLSILGNTIKFTANTENIWLVLAVAAVYFFFRYVQHLPPEWSKPSDQVDSIFAETLVWLSQRLHHRENLDAVKVRLREDSDHSSVVDFKVKPRGRLYFQGSYDPESGGYLSKKSDCEVIFDLPVIIGSPDHLCHISGYTNIIKPSKSVIRVSKLIAYLKGAFLAPWFTEHVFPMIFATAAIAAAAFRWYQVSC